ncbi:GSCFA domain-containing protein [Methylocystis parvus]|uniref:GSCFA domain-containing protein n=1 Tax=Methylocystis parvus TaxID=134 RepID=UPI003C742489
MRSRTARSCSSRPASPAATWDDNVYEFYNMTVSEVVRDFLAAVDQIREINPKVRIVLSVSPVGIIATYEDRHVVVSNTAVKSILRAAADEVTRARPNIAYFPSYDLVNVSPNAGRFYRDDTRRINPHGIDRTMKMFFDHFTDKAREEEAIKALKVDVAAEAETSARIVCDEEAIESA